MTTQEMITLRIGSQTKANGQPKQIGTFRTLTFDEVKAWSIPVSEPCTCSLGQRVVSIQTDDHAISYNRIHGTAYTKGCEFTVTCGSCHGTCTRLVDTTPSHIWFLSTHNDARQAKVNGKVRTWKRDLTRIEVPIKYGLYEYATFDKHDIEAGRLLERIS